MDSGCAMMGSHATMLKGHGMAGKENDPAATKGIFSACFANRLRLPKWAIA